MEVYIPDSVPDYCVPPYLTKGKRYGISDLSETGGGATIWSDNGMPLFTSFKGSCHLGYQDFRVVCMGAIG